tara:strand:- start:674 stop:1078 length:405 start_codon:yes stop_codon:yes gene_type:complete
MSFAIGAIIGLALTATTFAIDKGIQHKQMKKGEKKEEEFLKKEGELRKRERIDESISAFREDKLKEKRKWDDVVSESRNRYKEEGEKIGDMVNQQLIPREGVFTDQMYRQMGALSGTIQPDEKGYVEPELLKRG